MYEYNGIKIHWLGHDTFWLEAKGKNIYIDPYKISDKQNLAPADIIIVTHEHFDHCSVEDINTLSTENTFIVGATSCYEMLSSKVYNKRAVLELHPDGEMIDLDGIMVSAIPAYNTHRFRAPGQPFHPKESKHVGPIIHIDDIKIYHAGDTDKIPEMEDLQPDIAFLPVSGTYVMDVDEAVEAARAIKAKVTIPMHVGRGIGELSYREEFKKKLPDMEVVVLDIE